jgi:hypothetical protein
MKRSLFTAVLLLTLFSVFAAMAQTATPRVDARERRQQARIKQGVKSGELTKGETRRLEAQQGKIKADEMVAKSDGKVTPAERKQLTREQNRANRKIHRLKNNSKVQK